MLGNHPQIRPYDNDGSSRISICKDEGHLRLSSYTTETDMYSLRGSLPEEPSRTKRHACQDSRQSKIGSEVGTHLRGRTVRTFPVDRHHYGVSTRTNT